MPTARGWLLTATAATVWIVGIGFGAEGLTQLGFALVVLVAAAVAVVRLGGHELTVARRLAPERVKPGQRVTVTLTVGNTGRSRTPLILLEERLPPRVSGAARFTVTGIEPGGTRATVFEINANHRGRYTIGPLSVSFADPFALARSAVPGPGPASFLVHPRVRPLGPPPDHRERNSMVVSAVKQFTGTRGEDFFTLREYVEGDDLRKIHWSSTAKRGRYMIRQEETPWQTRATVLLDDSRGVHAGAGDESSFEHSVEAAASLVDLYHRMGHSFRLVTASGKGLPAGRGDHHLGRCLDLLATIAPAAPDTEVDPLLARLHELGSARVAEAALVAISPAVGPEVATRLAHATRQFRSVVLVYYPAHRFRDGDTRARWDAEAKTVEVVRVLTRSGVRTFVLGPGEPLAAAWNSSAVARTGKPRAWVQRPELV